MQYKRAIWRLFHISFVVEVMWLPSMLSVVLKWLVKFVIHFMKVLKDYLKINVTWCSCSLAGLDSPGSTVSDNFSFEDSNTKSPNSAGADSPNPTPGGGTSEADIDMLYGKAVELMELTEQLKSAPENLKIRTDNLQQLGHELKDSIDELKNQAQTALDKSVTAGN